MNMTRPMYPSIKRQWLSCSSVTRAFLVRCALLCTSVALASPALAAFHVMRVEQVIGSVNGNPSAQAIQLQMRAAGQNVVSATSLWAADATGSNRVLLLNIAANVSNSATGARILLTTPAFNTALQAGTPAFTPDFTLANPIPASYLTAGRLTFEHDGGTVAAPGTIIWSLSWGGSGYTGSNLGDATNDANGNFGPPYPLGLPTTGAQGIHLTSAATALSTTNAADYSLTGNPATVIKNSGTSFTLPVPPTALEAWRQTFFGTTANTGNAADNFDFDKDGLENFIEFAFGLNPTQNSAGQLPQPQPAGANMLLTFTQPAGVSDITYGAEKSTSLLAESWTAITDTGTGNQHTFSIPISSARSFMRLKVTSP